MKKFNTDNCVKAACAVLMAAGFQTAWAAEESGLSALSACNAVKVRGSYGYSEHGAIYPYYPDTSIRADFVEMGVFSLDGRGGGSGRADISIAGTVYRNVPLLNIRYTVNADCTGEASFDPGGDPSQRRTISFVFTAGADELHYISVEPGSSLVGVARKQR